MAAPASALAKVNIFSCAPEWSALAQEIGGDQVKVYTASNANQDIHHMRAKPSLLAAMRKADLVICSGASLEIGWLPILLNKAGGRQVQEGAIGSIMASDYVQRLGVMEGKVDRSMGDIHPEGNPHVHLDPNNLIIIAGVMAQRLSEIDADNAQLYEGNVQSFKTKWAGLIAAWQSQASALRGAKVAVYHKSWTYLLHWLGIENIASLEPKPGVPPTAAHLNDVLQKVQGQEVVGILIAPFESEKGAKWLSEKSGIPVIKLPFTIGGSDQTKDLESLFDDTLQRLHK